MIRRLAIVGLFPLLAGVSGRALAQERAQHTVAWYQTHQVAREGVLRACEDDHTYDDVADCRNALSAAHAALSDSLASTAGESQEHEADPAYYGHDAGMIAMMLAQCSRQPAPPQSWCQAAKIAQSHMGR